jgi:multiple sugar transport system ATP-binding protein
MAKVVLSALSKTFPGGTVALDHVDLEVADGEFVVLVGPSGCGKSTLLRIVAGLEESTGGTVAIDDVIVNDLAPKDRDIAMVFQNYALYPHMTVDENLSFSLRVHRVRRPIAEEQVQEVAHILALEPLLKRKPAALSGGQRQRVAMGRAMVRHPKVLLMDEPLSNLDAKLRVAMRGELMRLHQEHGTTTLYVTHDQVEAMTLGDRIAVLNAGRLQQIGTPDELYHAPANVFVAGFIGSPAMNLAKGKLLGAGQGLAIELGGQRMPVTGWAALRDFAGRDVVIGLRPSAFSLDAAAAAGTRLKVRAITVESLGDEKNVLFQPPFALAETAELTPMWTAKIEPAAAVRPGDEVELVVDLEQAYFFDPATGSAILSPDRAFRP